MPLEGQLKARLERALGVVDDHGVRGTRLLDDAKRLAARARRFIQHGVVPPDTDPTPLELACYALQLPLRTPRTTATGRPERTSLRDRAEQAAELLVGLAGNEDEALVEQATQLLTELHAHQPESDRARLLADVLNLEDFGVIGLIAQAVAAARQGGGVAQVAEGCQKREQYGYWDARLRDGFHFDPIRAIARKRLEHTRKTAALLLNELREDGAL